MTSKGCFLLKSMAGMVKPFTTKLGYALKIWLLKVYIVKRKFETVSPDSFDKRRSVCEEEISWRELAMLNYIHTSFNQSLIWSSSSHLSNAAQVMPLNVSKPISFKRWDGWDGRKKSNHFKAFADRKLYNTVCITDSNKLILDKLCYGG